MFKLWWGNSNGTGIAAIEPSAGTSEASAPGAVRTKSLFAKIGSAE